jgi:hypothetical protein
VPARDLLAAGAAYANSSAAFKNFRNPFWSATYAESSAGSSSNDSTEEVDGAETDGVQIEDLMLGDTTEMDFEDLMHDDEDFGDSAEMVEIMKNVLHAL